MDIVGNWQLLLGRINNAELQKQLLQIHMGAHDELRRAGNAIKANGRTVSEIAAEMKPEQRIHLIGDIGRSMINASGDILDQEFRINAADILPNCIFIALAAIIENLEGIQMLHGGNKHPIKCVYETVSAYGDPFGKLLPVLGQCYDWIEIKTEVTTKEPPAPPKPRYVNADDAKVLFQATGCARIDVMRTVFKGQVKRGTIRKAGRVYLIDASGRVITGPGIVLTMFSERSEISEAAEGKTVDELCVTLEIPKGTYDGLFLVEADEAMLRDEPAGKSIPTHTEENTREKQGLFGRLLKNLRGKKDV